MKMMFIDYEANGFKGGLSYPISVGYVVYDTETRREVEEGYHLIKPTEEWEGEAWDWYAEKRIHKLSKKLLREQGTEAKDVADALVKVECDVLVSDAKRYDKVWQDLLLLEGSNPDATMNTIKNLEEFVSLEFWSEHRKRIQDMFEIHNALEDAKRNLKIYQEYILYKEAAN